MDIFISGDLNSFAPTIIRALLADGHHLVTSGNEEVMKNITHKNFVSYDMTPKAFLYSEIFTSHSFDAVIHIMDQAGLLTNTNPINSVRTSGATLESTLQYAAKSNVEKFILISSMEIYGDEKNLIENTKPVPASVYGQLLLNAENLCEFYSNDHIAFSIVRIPVIYGPNESYSLLADLMRQSQKNKKVDIPFDKQENCNFLHIDDLISIIKSTLEDNEPYHLHRFNLGTEDINFFFLAQQLNIRFPNVTYQFSEESGDGIGQKKTWVENAKTIYNWRPQHNLIADIPDLPFENQKAAQPSQSFSERLSAFTKKLKPFLVWLEVILGAFLMHMITVWTNTIIEFKVIDYRLIYVVLIGSIHGLLYGIIAAILAATSAVVSWDAIGLDFALLLYNVENWIPFTVYFLAGAVTGYVHDKQENELQFEKSQTDLIHEKYTFLYSLYNEISTIKNRLREQLFGYRDSFGRFFRIANELNELDEDNIFFKALEILQDVMKNDQIAIYSIESTGHYGRLQVSSKSLTKDISKSLRLEDFDSTLPVLKGGEIFQNKDLVANLPAYIAPIMNGEILIGVIVIWNADFNQFNMYYYNLFKVITGLIQSSLVRAATFENARLEKMYLPGTRILRPEPFRQALSIRKKMRRNKVSEFQILRIHQGNQNWEKLYDKISRNIRNEDVVGLLDEKADTCFIILANAAAENVSMIQDRMNNNGLSSDHIQDLEIE